MARSLKIAGWCLLGVLLAGCSSMSSTTASSQRLTNVLSTQKQAEAAYTSNDMQRAATLYLQLTKMIPQEADYWYLLGNAYVRTDQPDRAVDAYQQAIVRNPNHTRAWHNLGIVRMRQAMAAFTSSAGTAKAGDPMHEVSTQLVNELARIGSGGLSSSKLQDPVSMAAPLPVPVSRPAASTAAGMSGSPGSAAAKRGANDSYPLRRRPGGSAGVNQP